MYAKTTYRGLRLTREGAKRRWRSGGGAAAVAQRLAEELEVDLATLQQEAPLAQKETLPAKKPRVSYRKLHQAYLKVLLGREVGSTYSAMGEKEIDKHCEGLSWEGVLEIISCRGREAEVLRGVLEDPDLHPEVRLFLEEVLGGYPDQDIRILAAARYRERSEKGREELTRALRQLL